MTDDVSPKPINCDFCTKPHAPGTDHWERPCYAYLEVNGMDLYTENRKLFERVDSHEKALAEIESLRARLSVAEGAEKMRMDDLRVLNHQLGEYKVRLATSYSENTRLSERVSHLENLVEKEDANSWRLSFLEAENARLREALQAYTEEDECGADGERHGNCRYCSAMNALCSRQDIVEKLADAIDFAKQPGKSPGARGTAGDGLPDPGLNANREGSRPTLPNDSSAAGTKSSEQDAPAKNPDCGCQDGVRGQSCASYHSFEERKCHPGSDIKMSNKERAFKFGEEFDLFEHEYSEIERALDQAEARGYAKGLEMAREALFADPETDGNFYEGVDWAITRITALQSSAASSVSEGKDKE